MNGYTERSYYQDFACGGHLLARISNGGDQNLAQIARRKFLKMVPYTPVLEEMKPRKDQTCHAWNAQKSTFKQGL